MTNDVHPFERAGLGLAPFRCVSVTDAGRIARGCEYCGTGIRILCTIKSADGRHFVVGSDCVAKTSIKVDMTLALEVRKQVDEIKREKAARRREAKRAAEWECAVAAIREAREILERYPDRLTDKPHPAYAGKTYRDYAQFILANAGATTTLWMCGQIKRVAREREEAPR